MKQVTNGFGSFVKYPGYLFIFRHKLSETKVSEQIGWNIQSA